MAGSGLPFHPLALALGLVGALLLVGAVLGATGSGLLPPVFQQSAVWVTLAVLGVIAIAVEVALVLAGIRRRSP